MKFQAVLFDLDGTLLDTAGGLAATMNSVLSLHNLPVHDIAFYKKIIGKGFRNLVMQSLPTGKQMSEVIDAVYKEAQKEYGKRCLPETRIFTGVLPLLNELKKIDMKMAVFSNKENSFTQSLVKGLLGNDYFSEVSGIIPGVTPEKPDPTEVLNICRNMKINPGNWIYLGDSDIDMKTAQSSGMYPVGASWGYQPITQIQEGGAKKLIDYPNELLQLIN